MTESGKRQEVITLYPHGNGSKIPFHSRIGTKLIVGFLIIATITGSVGYLSLNYAQTVGEKFHLLEQQSLPTIDSLKEMKVAALNVELHWNCIKPLDLSNVAFFKLLQNNIFNDFAIIVEVSKLP